MHMNCTSMVCNSQFRMSRMMKLSIGQVMDAIEVNRLSGLLLMNQSECIQENHREEFIAYKLES